MSLRKGDNKKPGQKHQNKTVFKIKYDVLAIEHKSKIQLDRLCKRCLEQIQWKVKFNKYKPMKTPGKCNRCGDKNILKTYRNCCDSCSDQLNICTKCEQQKDFEEPILPEKKDSPDGVDKVLLAEMEDYMSTLRERSRRTIIRKIKANVLTWKDDHFIFKETGLPIENLKFKKDFEDSEMDEEDEDNEKEERKNNKEKKVKKQAPAIKKETLPKDDKNSDFEDLDEENDGDSDDDDNE